MSLPVLSSNLRFASPEDLLRLSVVATCGYSYTPCFSWERPHYEKYPEDTLLSYQHTYASAIKSPDHIVVVALDKYERNEGKKSKAIIPPNNGAKIPAEGDDVIVALAYWKLEPGSKHIGKLPPGTGPYPKLPPNLDRDKCQTHCTLVDEWDKVVQKKYFQGYATLEMLVVHPAYQGRGHGENLVKWGMELARADKVKQGVTVLKNHMGMDFRKLGWKYLTEIRIEGDKKVPQGLCVDVMEYDPTVG